MSAHFVLGYFGLRSRLIEKNEKLRKSSFLSSILTLTIFCILAVTSLSSQTFHSLVNFGGRSGATPQWGALAQGLDGNFYGTTSSGGLGIAGSCFRNVGQKYCGTAFKMSPDGSLTTLYNFTGGGDGGGGMPGLVLDTNGENFYGLNSIGGDRSVCHSFGCGVIFKMSPAGSLTPLYAFNFTDGANPNSPLLQATNGNFYGTGTNGGTSSACFVGCGAIFVMTPDGIVTRLHSFDLADGGNPQNAVLIQASNFAIYGETTGGGRPACSLGCGTIFKMTLGGTFQMLHRFSGAGGSEPTGGLVEAADGSLYGTTRHGGPDDAGTVFKITADGRLTTLHFFHGPDGQIPDGGLVQATDGNLYGTTSGGGANGDGTIYRITSTGAIATLHDFDGSDGSGSNSALLQATNGKLYGTTTSGGTGGGGTIFSLDLGLDPFVKLLPARGKVGKIVRILGNNLTGTTGVNFNGGAATFTVISDTAIEATVPAAATTGKVEVLTPGGTLQSNLAFRLTP